MEDEDISLYMKTLKSKPIKKIEIKSSKRQQALNSQKGKCAKCKRDLNTSYSKYVEDPITKTTKVLCSDCAINTVKKN